MEEEREEAEGNPSGVVYAVAVKTDVEIIVGNLLRQILVACSLFLLCSGNCVRGHRLGASVSRSAKRRLKSLCTLQHSWETLRTGMKIMRLWANYSACTPQTSYMYIRPSQPEHLDCAIARCSPQGLTTTKRSTWPPSATKQLKIPRHRCTRRSDCC